MDNSILYFTAPWCTQCRLQKKIMQDLADEGYKIIEYSADKNPDIFEQWKIMSIPAYAIPLEADGSQHIILYGNKTKDTLKESFKEFLNPPKTQTEEQSEK